MRRRAAERQPSASATKRRGGAVTRSAGGANNTSAELRDALNTPLQQSGLTFSVQAAPVQAEPERSVSRAGHRVRRRGLEFARPTDSGAVFANKHRAVVFRHRPERRAQRATRTELNLDTAARNVQAREERRVARESAAACSSPGDIRFASARAIASAGRVGTVFYDLHVPDFRKEPVDVERPAADGGVRRTDAMTAHARSRGRRNCCPDRPPAGGASRATTR